MGWDRLDDVPLHSGRLRVTGEQQDFALGVPDDIKGGELLIFANGRENRFLTEYVHFAVVAGGESGTPIYFGFAAVAREPMGASGEAGVTVLGGFNARQSPDQSATLLFLRGL